MEHSVKTLQYPLYTELLEILQIEWRNSTPAFAWMPERRNETAEEMEK